MQLSPARQPLLCSLPELMSNKQVRLGNKQKAHIQDTFIFRRYSAAWGRVLLRLMLDHSDLGFGHADWQHMHSFDSRLMRQLLHHPHPHCDHNVVTFAALLRFWEEDPDEHGKQADHLCQGASRALQWLPSAIRVSSLVGIVGHYLDYHQYCKLVLPAPSLATLDPRDAARAQLQHYWTWKSGENSPQSFPPFLKDWNIPYAPPFLAVFVPPDSHAQSNLSEKLRKLDFDTTFIFVAGPGTTVLASGFLHYSTISEAIFVLPFVVRADFSFLAHSKRLQSVDFVGCHNLTRIGACWLEGCRSLTRISFHGLCQLQTIGDYWMERCVSMRRVSFAGMPRLRSVGQCWMQSCMILQEASFQELENLVRVGGKWLESCTALIESSCRGLSQLRLRVCVGDGVESLLEKPLGE